MDVELRAKRDALEYLWRQGLSGQALISQHSQLIDDYLADCFAKCPEAREGMSLTALGGYGRRELFPFSDIDLLLLYEPQVESRLSTVTEALFYPLWDAGLEVGHGVRTREACLADAKDDFFFQVAMLDARPLAGSVEMFTDLKKTFRQDIIEGHRREFLENMLSHRESRHKQYGRHSYQLEPHIKESRGGFRDIHGMMWVAQALFGLSGLPAIEEAGLLAEQERIDFESAWNHLIKIRNRLHYLSSRKNDQLYFEHQEEMAKAFKYRDSNGVLGVERFMQDVYRHMQTVATCSDLFFEHVDESLGTNRPAALENTVEPGITVRQNRLHLTDPDLIKKRPYLLMRLFAHAAQMGLEIHHRSRKLVTANLGLIDDSTQRSKRMAKAFLETLQVGNDPLPALEVMMETGLLEAYIPEFAQINSLAQHDVYHIFTVDRHLAQTVAELKKIPESEATFSQVDAPHILYLAALLHDIGKGHQDDHSTRGGKLVKDIGERLSLTKTEIKSLCFLVEKHLFLTVTALRRDLEDQELIKQCAKQIQSGNHLAMLYLLSIADAKATGPTAWNEWKSTLLQELFFKIRHLLSSDVFESPDRSGGAEWMRRQIAEKLGSKNKYDLSQLPEEYLLSFQPDEIINHLDLRRKVQAKRCVVQADDHDHYWSVLVMAKDTTGLLAKICGSLALHGLNVFSAQIFTWADGTAVDILNVRPQNTQPFAEQDWKTVAQDLNQALSNRLGLTHRLVNKFKSSYNISPKQLLSEPKVVIDNKSSDQYTIIEVYANDRPGLLYDITRGVADFEINIHRAKIGTEGDQIVDVFYCLDSQQNKINNPDFQEEIKEALLYTATQGRLH